VRWNAALAYLGPARSRPNLTVMAGTTADRLVLDGTRARGVRVTVARSAFDVEADTVVLCAGAYGSAALLLRSGVGPERELGRHGIPPVAALPVGEGLAEHFGVRMRLEPSEELLVEVERHLEQHELFLAHGLVRAAPRGGPWDTHLLPMLLPTGSGRVEGPAEKPYSLGLTAMLLRPSWRGSVTLASADPAAVPVVTGLAFETADLDAAALSLELARHLLDSDAVRACVAGELVPGDDVGRGEDARAYLAAEPPSRYFHPQSTCALGTVVDENARVRGFDNLHVADASLIPEPIRAGTNWTAMAIAEHAARLVA
jgi:choline dehydrogenase